VKRFPLALLALCKSGDILIVRDGCFDIRFCMFGAMSESRSIYFWDLAGVSADYLFDNTDNLVEIKGNDCINWKEKFTTIILLGDLNVNDYLECLDKAGIINCLNRPSASHKSGSDKISHFNEIKYYIYPREDMIAITYGKSFIDFPFLSFETGLYSRVRSYLFGILSSLAPFRNRKVYCLTSYRLKDICDSNTDRKPLSFFKRYQAYIRCGRIAVVFDEKKVIKIPLSSTALQSLRRSVEHTKDARYHAPNKMRFVIPEILGNHLEDYPYYVEEKKCNGVLATNYRMNMISYRKAIRNAVDFITALHVKSRRCVTVTRDEYDRIIGSKISFLRARSPSRYVPLFDRIESFISGSFIGKQIYLVFSHGDYWSGNMIVSGNDLNLTGVIDWDNSDHDQLPLLDIIHLISMRNKHITNKFFALYILYVLLPMRLMHWEKEIVHNYMREVGLSDKLWDVMIISYWMQRCYLWYQIDVSNPDCLTHDEKRWIEMSLYNVLGRICHRLEALNTNSISN